MTGFDHLCLRSSLCMMYTYDCIDIHEIRKVWEDKKEKYKIERQNA